MSEWYAIETQMYCCTVFRFWMTIVRILWSPCPSLKTSLLIAPNKSNERHFVDPFWIIVDNWRHYAYGKWILQKNFFHFNLLSLEEVRTHLSYGNKLKSRNHFLRTNSIRFSRRNCKRFHLYSNVLWMLILHWALRPAEQRSRRRQHVTGQLIQLQLAIRIKGRESMADEWKRVRPAPGCT